MKTHLYKKDILKVCHKGHLTASEIYKFILKNHPSASQSSIYRNIESMVHQGKLKKLEGIGKKSYFETNTGDHIHLIDQNTGKIMDLDNIEINIPNVPQGFKINFLDIKVFGEFR